MEVTMHLQLLLLICSLCAAQLQTEADNEIAPLGRQPEFQRGEPTNASAQQNCPQDIHAVLREMSVLLAEQKVEMRHLQRQNEAQAAKLRELELQRMEVDKLTDQLQAQAAELISIKARSDVTENQVEALRKDGEAQAAELISIQARSNVTENQVETLRRDGEGRQVAFSASLLASGSGTLGPYNTHVPLVFRYVATNIGNAYNPNTGFFIAPVRGAYHFEYYVGAHGSGHASGCMLHKNGQPYFIAYEHQTNGYGSSANGITLLLEVGEVVYLRLWQNTRIFDNVNHHSTFSGHLLFTM